MRYPTRASELVHRRLQVPPSLLHDTSCTPTSRRYVWRGIIAYVVLDLGHQRVPTLWFSPKLALTRPDAEQAKPRLRGRYHVLSRCDRGGVAVSRVVVCLQT